MNVLRSRGGLVHSTPCGHVLLSVRPHRCPQPLQSTGHRQARSRRHVVQASLDPDNASILVCGGGGVGLMTSRKLKDYGCWVWLMQRGDSRKAEIEQMGAILLKGDALDKDAIEQAFSAVDDLDVVISTIGGTPANPQADSQGNINLIDAAVKKGVKKFVLLTSIGTGDSKDAPPAQVYEVLKSVLVEKAKAENHLKGLKGDMSWTIIRPGGLKSEPATGNGVLTENTSVCGAIHREDVAALLVQAVFSSSTDKKVLSAVDTKQLYGEPQYETFKL